MNILNKLTIKNLKLNKKRTIVTIIGIILSVALICAVASMLVSFRKSMIKYTIEGKGDYHFVFYDVKKDDLESFENNRNIERLYISENIGYAPLEKSENPDKKFAFLIGAREKDLNGLAIKILKGRMAKNDNEIVIPRHLKANGRVDYKIGDEITLDIGDRYSDDYLLDQGNPYLKEEETFKKRYTKTYKIVGIMERPSNFIESFEAPGYTFLTYYDLDSDSYNTYAKYTKYGVKNYERTTAKILGINEEHYYSMVNDYNKLSDDTIKAYNKEFLSAKYHNDVNEMLITLSTLSFKNASMNALYAVGGIVILIIIFTSIYCIKNSFDISITEKTKQYGMLRSIGATSKQIKKNVLNEAYILWLVGAPVGILCGIFAAFVLIKVSNHFLGNLLVFGALIFKTSILAIVLSIILSFITIYFSALKIARRASKLSPMSAIRSQDDIRIKSKKIRSPKYIQKLFGIGGIISYKNIKRNRKKYRTTVISIVVSVSVFIGLYYFMGLGRKTLELEFGQMTHNIELSVNNKDYNKIKSILNFDNISKYSVKRTTQYSINDNLYTKEYMKFYGDSFKDTTIEVYAFGKSEYIRYINKLKLNYDEVKDKAIIINNTIQVEDGKNVELSVLNVKTRQILNGGFYDFSTDDYSKNKIEVAKVTTLRPMGIENNYGQAFMIISDELFDEIYKNGESMGSVISCFIDSTNADKLQEEIEKFITDKDSYNLYNNDKAAKDIQGFYTLLAIFLYGFITVIALIGVTNIFNTINTNMNLRKGEFAILKSVGMTGKEFNRMINLEVLFYSLKSLLIGVPLGIGLSYVLYLAFNQGKNVILYKLPVGGIIISIIAVFILVFIIMRFSIRKVSEQNIIENIRNENI